MKYKIYCIICNYKANLLCSMSYGIIFRVSSSFTKKMLISQNKIIKIMTTEPRDSYREIFKKLEIMMLYSRYKYSLLLYIINNKYVFNFNRRSINIQLDSIIIYMYHQSVLLNSKKEPIYISGIKIFSHLPQSIKNLANDEKNFKFALKRSLYHHSFYYIEKTKDCNMDAVLIFRLTFTF
jgi:hypothetical protein